MLPLRHRLIANERQDVKILVPHGRKVWEVRADGAPCSLMTTETPMGFGYNVETWQTRLPEPPTEITIKLETLK